MSTIVTWMNRSATRRMPAAKLEGAVTSDPLTASSSNQLMKVATADFAAPSGFIDGPMIRVQTDEDIFVAAGDNTINATAAATGTFMKGGTVEYFEVEPGSFVAVATAKA